MRSSENTLLHQDANPARLILILKLLFAMWVVRFLFDPFERISQLPPEFTAPVSFLKLLPPDLYTALHSFGGLLVIKLLIVGCGAGVWVPRFRMPCALFGCIFLTIACAITRGFGHVNHAEIGPLLVTWVLTIYALRIPIEQTIRPDKQQNQLAATGLILATIIFMLCYAFAGIARLSWGGLQMLGGESITNRMVEMAYHDWRFEYNFADVVLAMPPVLFTLKLGTAVVTVIEIAAPFCLVSRKFRVLFLLIMPAFHLGTIVLFKIDFIENVCVIFLLVGFARIEQLACVLRKQPSTVPTV